MAIVARVERFPRVASEVRVTRNQREMRLSIASRMMRVVEINGRGSRILIKFGVSHCFDFHTCKGGKGGKGGGKVARVVRVAKVVSVAKVARVAKVVREQRWLGWQGLQRWKE